MKKKMESWKNWKILIIIKIMKKLFIYIGFFILTIGITLFLADRFYQKKISLLLQDKTLCQKELTQKNQPLSTLNDAYLVVRKEIVLASVKKSLLTFSAVTAKLSQDKWKVTVWLNGNSQGAADASDLKLNLPASAIVTDLKTGSAFPIYPRQVIDEKYLLITGLASFNNNQFVLARPQKIFVEFTIEISNLLENERKIIVDQTDTKIYLNGESVYNPDQPFNQITLP